MKKKHHIFRTLILIIALVVLGVSLFKIISGKMEYKKGRDEYDKIRDTAVKDEDPDKGVNWKKLRKINPDIVAWIRFKHPKVINYPVVQGKDNSLYLNKSFGENYIKAGTIFVNCDNIPDFKDANTIIYGHNMNDGSMFASLKKYEDHSFYKKHPTFFIYTPDDVRHTYRIFAAGTYLADSRPATQYRFADEADFADLLEEIRAGSLYQTDIPVTTADHIVTLYTCTNVREADRWLVFGVEESSRKINH